MKSIISVSLGFLTIPFVIAIVTGIAMGAGQTGRWIIGLNLPLAEYWLGFGLLVGSIIIAGCAFGLLETISTR